MTFPIDYYKKWKCKKIIKKLTNYQRESQTIFDEFKLTQTKFGEPVLICRRITDVDSIIMMFYVFFVSFNKVNKMKANLIIDNNRIKIGDILPLNSEKDYNRGYGSILIQEIISWAKEHGFEEIYGDMVSSQKNELRQEHFYHKNGFTINNQNKLLLKL